MGVGVMSMFGGVACDTAHGAQTGTIVPAGTYGLNEGWFLRGEGHNGVRVLTKNYPTGTAVISLNNDGNFGQSIFFGNNGFGAFDATLLDPAIAHLFPNNGFMILTDFSYRVTNGVRNVTFFGVHFTL